MDRDRRLYYSKTGRTPRPAITVSNGPSVYNLVIIDLIQLTDGNHMLAKALWDRKVSNKLVRDYEGEILDYICYLKQSLLEGKSYLEPIYHRAIALAVDQMNLSYVNSGGESQAPKTQYVRDISNDDKLEGQYSI